MTSRSAHYDGHLCAFLVRRACSNNPGPSIADDDIKTCLEIDSAVDSDTLEHHIEDLGSQVTIQKESMADAEARLDI